MNDVEDNHKGSRPDRDRCSGGKFGFEYARDPNRSSTGLSGSFFLDKSVRMGGLF